MTLFKQIIDRKIPAQIVFEDEQCLAFHDIHPQAPIHILLIPKKEIPSLKDLTDEDNALLGHLLITAANIAKKVGLESSGYRVVTNIGKDGGQSVSHLHFHILGGRSMMWPPG